MKALIKKALGLVGLAEAFTLRTKLARRHLSGTGLEIGAMHKPVRVPRGTKVKYVDISTREESIRKFPELNPRDIVAVDYVSDGFTLTGVPDNAFDFLVANHVLEHSPDPIATLVRWSEVLKDSGVLYCSVPIVDMCFDKGRPITPYSHMLEDFRQRVGTDPEAARARNKPHYLEWLTVSLPAITGKPGPGGPALESRVEEWAGDRSEIHFHTFNSASVRELFEGVRKDVLPHLQILEIADSGGEIIVIARKTPAS